MRRLAFCMGALLVASLGWTAAFAEESQGPDRKATAVAQVTQHLWWLLPWADGPDTCQIVVEHEGLPNHGEVLYFCGPELLDAWIDTPACDAISLAGEPTGCSGYYLHLAGSTVVEREVEVDLPPPEVWVSLNGCEPVGLSHRCIGEPSLQFSASEPLSGEHITAINAEIDGEAVICESSSCEVPLGPYPEEGIEITFWAESSYGDESELQTALVRSLLLESQLESGVNLWQVDVLSDHWLGEPLAACSFSWEAFPPVNQPSWWLEAPTTAEDLATDEPLDLLAGRLLSWGLVDASACPWGGLLPDGNASQCGVESSRHAVDEWQNRFDARIFEVAHQSGVPAWIMKGLFEQETQFWPGGFPSIEEYGLGGLGVDGGDTLLLWNTSFYRDFCPLVLSDAACQNAYHQLDDASQDLLRGALAIQADVNCPECEDGVDLDKAEQSVDLFAEILLAGCDQVAQVVRTATRSSPGLEVSYEDLWRFVLVNYNAGPGCLTEAIDQVSRLRLSLTWENVSAALGELPACDAAVGYVDQITQGDSGGG